MKGKNFIDDQKTTYMHVEFIFLLQLSTLNEVQILND